jgi:uncharacterized protein (UPF0332 family)
MIDGASLFLQKALESLDGAESEAVNGRYNNAANRAYYACFQAAIYALSRAGLKPRGDEWSHAYVPATFDGELINRRKLYETSLRGVVGRNLVLRLKADYRESTVSQTEANRALRRTRDFVLAIQARGGGSR